MKQTRLSELLAPAGSPAALRAALAAGADAVYLGLPRFNARVGAENFNKDSLKDAVRLCRLFGKKLYITLNTLVFDREIPEVLDEVEFAMSLGVDAFIVQDFGLIKLLLKVFPDIVIHSSTQCATHNMAQIEALSKMGVSRAVVARELSEKDLKIICKNSSVEIEAFVHGALCMSHSGTCLMSAYMGGRSGNRGECAQPCRLPWSLDNSKCKYPLSLHDLSLARFVPELIEMGVSSFKIEGRMKSPEYVFGVVKIWRRLIDENRGATDEEMRELESIFSREGFTDGYYTGKKGASMFGTRALSDKEKSRKTAEEINPELEKIPVSAVAKVSSEQIEVEFFCRGVSVKASCEVFPAEGSGTGEEVIKEALSKLGSTPFILSEIDISCPDPVFIKRSALNELRRTAADALFEKLTAFEKEVKRLPLPSLEKRENSFKGYAVVFREGAQVLENEVRALCKKAEIKRVFVPFSSNFDCPDPSCGILLPKAVFDSEREGFEKRLDVLYEKGYRTVLCENLGVAKIAKDKGFRLLGGAGLNVTNSFALSALMEFGFEDVILSHETSPAQRRDIASFGAASETVFGRTPLMLVENCPLGVRDGCISRDCEFCRKTGNLTDRQNEVFSVFPDWRHRSLIYNSRPTYLADTPVTQGVSYRVISVTGERVGEVVDAVLNKKAPMGKFTRK